MKQVMIEKRISDEKYGELIGRLRSQCSNIFRAETGGARYAGYLCNDILVLLQLRGSELFIDIFAEASYNGLLRTISDIIGVEKLGLHMIERIT